MNASSIIQVDFGHRTVDITVGFLRDMQTSYDHATACKALRFKPAIKPAVVQTLIEDIAASTPGAQSFACDYCNAETYGAEGVIGSTACTECDELAGWDNHVNDSGEPMDDSTRETVQALLKTIEANGGDPLLALSTCDFLNTGDQS